MKTFKMTQRSKLRFVLPLTFFVAGLICVTAMGHEWSVDGKKVKAKVVDFNGRHVLLENQRGKQKAFPINGLVAEDLAHLSNLLAIHNAETQKKLANEQMNQQQIALMSQFVDIWTVSLVAPNGETGVNNYFAANSLHAKRLALRDFPTARIINVRRMRRSGGLLGFGSAGGVSNAGMEPVINQFPDRPILNIPLR